MSTDIPGPSIANSDHLANQCPIKLDNLALQTIRFGRRNVNEAVVMTYLLEIAKKAKYIKIAVVSPHFSDQFKDFTGAGPHKLEAKKTNSRTNAHEFIYVHRDHFDIALIPIHTHKPDHWSLGILDRRNNTARFCELSEKLTLWQDALLSHAISTIFFDPTTQKNETKWIKPEVTNELKKYNWDAHYNTGIYICVVARKYVESDEPLKPDTLDLDKERSDMYEELKELVVEEAGDRMSGRKSMGKRNSIDKSIKQEICDANHIDLKTIANQNLGTSHMGNSEIPLELEIKSELDEHQAFEVDKVLDYKVGIDSKRYFLVSWKGFPESENSWEPEDNILFDAQNFLKTIGTSFTSQNVPLQMTARKRSANRRKSGGRWTRKKRKVASEMNEFSQSNDPTEIPNTQEVALPSKLATTENSNGLEIISQVSSSQRPETSQQISVQQTPIQNEYCLEEHPAKLTSHHLVKADNFDYIFRVTDRRKAAKLLCACQGCLMAQQKASSIRRKNNGVGVTYTVGTLIFQPDRHMLLGDPSCPRGTPHCCEIGNQKTNSQSFTTQNSTPSSAKNSKDPYEFEADLEDAPHENIIDFNSTKNKKFPQRSMFGKAPFIRPRPSSGRSPLLRPRLSNANETAQKKAAIVPPIQKNNNTSIIPAKTPIPVQCIPNQPSVSQKKNSLIQEINKPPNTQASNEEEFPMYKHLFIAENLIKVEGHPYTFFIKSQSDRPILRCQDCQELVEAAKQKSQLIPAVGHIILDKEDGIVGDPTKPSNIPHICKFKHAIKPKKIIKKRKRKSAAWKYADQLEAGFVRCKICGMVRQSFGGTSVMIEHLKKEHPVEYVKAFGSASPPDLVKNLAGGSQLNAQEKPRLYEQDIIPKPISIKIKRISNVHELVKEDSGGAKSSKTSSHFELISVTALGSENGNIQQSNTNIEMENLSKSSENQPVKVDEQKSSSETIILKVQKPNRSENTPKISSSIQPPEHRTDPKLDFTPVNSIGSFERQALDQMVASNNSPQSPHPSTSTTSELNEDQPWNQDSGRRSPIDIKPRFNIRIPSQSSLYSNSPNVLSPALTPRLFENVKPKKLSHFGAIRIVSARSNFTKNVDVADCPFKFGYPHTDGLAPIVQTTDPEKYSNEEIDRIKSEVCEQLTQIRDGNSIVSNNKKSRLFLVDTLMIGLNENAIKNCHIVRAQFPFLPSWFLKVLYKHRKLLNFFTSSIDTVFYGLGYDLLRCYKKEKTSITVNSIVRDLDEFIAAIMAPEDDLELTNVKTVVFITIPEIGILQDTISNFNEGVRQAIGKLQLTYQKTVNVQLLDWAKLVEESESTKLMDESSCFDDRIKLLLAEVEMTYGVECEAT